MKKEQELVLGALIAVVLVTLWVRSHKKTPLALLGRTETHVPITPTDPLTQNLPDLSGANLSNMPDTLDHPYHRLTNYPHAPRTAPLTIIANNNTPIIPIPKGSGNVNIAHAPRMAADWVRQNVFHVDPYWLGNSAQGIHTAKAKGYNGVDLDLNMSKDAVFVVNHWPQPFMHGAYDPTGKYKKGSTVRIQDMTWAEIQKHVRYPGDIRPISALHAAKIGADLGVYTDFEAKGDPRFTNTGLWARLYRSIHAQSPHWRGTVTSLPNLTFNRTEANRATDHSINTLTAAGNAGFVTGLLYRGKPDIRYFTEAHISYVKGGPFWNLYRQYNVARLTGKNARYYR